MVWFRQALIIRPFDPGKLMNLAFGLPTMSTQISVDWLQPHWFVSVTLTMPEPVEVQ